MIARGTSIATLRELCKGNMAYYSQVLEDAWHASGCIARSWVETEYTFSLGRFYWGLGWDAWRVADLVFLGEFKTRA